MADKYAVTKARLDDLSTSVQELTGSATGLTLEQMQEQLDAANAEVAAQAALIEEISGILDGKAGGSGGGAAIETCTVRVVGDDQVKGLIKLSVTVLTDNGTIDAACLWGGSFPVDNVVCRSAVGVVVDNVMFADRTISCDGDTICGAIHSMKAPSTQGGVLTITIS